ncbi:MAG: hypothetical protein ROZ37_15930 [Aromatoleum sp.]|jgi:hypothetical protein|uniref:hypothetical protein n=1 Tax=Aromatoleum sp. TaxID=2307007 RepID=UPI00289544B2|nr:hypothetical protein [Aromatoleum sp.]MDT3671806.1 hypothetical protein [Aromatoleum sp.]
MKQEFQAPLGVHRIGNLTDPDHGIGGNTAPCSVSIEHVAHILASTCCFAGRASAFYSVAQHDYLASTIVPPEDALAALLLHAGDALKELVPLCLDAEGQTTADILADLGAPPCLPASVKYADLILRTTARSDLDPSQEDAWIRTTHASPLTQPIQPLAPIVAKHLFVDRYFELRPEADPRRPAIKEDET